MSDQNSSKAVSPGKPKAAPTPVLVFREAPYGSSLVFTAPERAAEIDRLNRVIESSETWGEFRRKIGPEEYAKLYEDVFYKPEPDDDPEDIDEDQLE